MSFKRFDPDDLVISSDAVTATVWSNNAPTLSTFFTSSVQVAGNAGLYYYEIYNGDVSNTESANQFDVVYCDKNGSGSVWYNAIVTGNSPTKTMYGQYRSLVLGDENADFIFGNYTSSYFYAISIDRARYKESLFPGSLTLVLSGSGTNRITLTDDSQIAPSVVFKDAGRVYNLVTGSAGTVNTSQNALGWTPGSGSYGWLLPDIGILLLNGAALDGNAVAGGISLGTVRGSNTNNTNPAKLFNALKAGSNFKLNSQETLTSDYIFVRARNSEFNYSENPTYISGSTGEVLYDLFINSPQTYITTVGLYNDANELLAVAKLSRPLVKDFTREILVRTKLDF